MMSKLLSIAGTGLLLLCAAFCADRALRVVRDQPKLSSLVQEVALQDAEAGKTPSAIARPARPDIFYAAITDRPLFTPDRRPGSAQQRPAPAPKPEIVQAAPVAPPAPVLSLLGVMGRGDEQRALIAKEGTEPSWVSKQTQVEGWTITAIGPDWLDLSFEADTIRIEMYQQ